METEQELLRQGLSELDCKASDDIVALFMQYLSELQKWNRAYNLTALKNNSDIITKHFFDSLLFLKAFPGMNGRLCDVGSGAGFPGVPIAITRPDISITLIEPSRKKCAFLRNITRMLALSNITVIEARIEDITDIEFDIAVTRALFSVAEFMKKAAHIIRKGGCLIMSKGPKFEDELKNIPPSAHFEHITAVLPLTSVQRHLIKITF